MVKNARWKGRSPSASPSLYLYIWGSVRALPFVCQRVGASPHRPPHAYTYMYGEIARALPFVCHGVRASPHRPLHAYIDMYGNHPGPTVHLPWGGDWPPPAPTSFSCLDTRKGGKRRSRLRSPKLKDELRTLKSEKLASLRSASDTRISGRVLATRLSGRLGTDAVPPDAQWSTDGLTDKKWALPYASGSRFLSVRVGAYCIRPIGRLRKGDECGCGVWMSRPFLGLRRGRRGRDGSVFWTAEGWGLPIRQVF